MSHFSGFKDEYIWRVQSVMLIIIVAINEWLSWQRKSYKCITCVFRRLALKSNTNVSGQWLPCSDPWDWTCFKEHSWQASSINELTSLLPTPAGIFPIVCFFFLSSPCHYLFPVCQKLLRYKLWILMLGLLVLRLVMGEIHSDWCIFKLPIYISCHVSVSLSTLGNCEVNKLACSRG